MDVVVTVSAHMDHCTVLLGILPVPSFKDLLVMSVQISVSSAKLTPDTHSITPTSHGFL